MREDARREVVASLRRLSPPALARAARQRWRRGGPAAVAWALRLTGAAVTSFVVASAVLPGAAPLTAPLTTMLVVQLTPVALLASGADRIIAVVSGVLVAVVVSSVLPLSWWSLAMVIATAILVGQLLRLKNNLIEVAISAMLVLGAGSLGSTATAWDRIAETLIGAAVGILVTLALPPRIASGAAGSALEGLADRIADLLRRSSDGFRSEPSVTEGVRDWLGSARQVNHDLPVVGAAVLRAEEGRRYNLRALAAVDAGPGLREGIETLENTAITVRAMYRALVDASAALSSGEGRDGGPETDPDDRDEGAGDDLAELVREAAALALEDMAGAVRSFGDVVVADVRRRDGDSARHRLDSSLEDLREAQARLTDLVLADDARFSALNTTLLQAADRLIVDLSPERRDSSLAQHPPRGLPARLERFREDRRAGDDEGGSGILGRRDVPLPRVLGRRRTDHPTGPSSPADDDR